MADPALAVPLATFRLCTRYFRYEVDGFEVLADSPSSLIVAYHGGPWTVDLWMLAARMHDELGYFPRAFWHRVWWTFPGLRHAVTELGGLPGRPSAAEIRAVKARGEHLVVAPGGTREGLRPFWRQHRVDFGGRRGYLRLAAAHDLPIIPVASSGLDETFLGLSHGHAVPTRPLGDAEIPAWLAVGIGGLWPFALPFPVKVRQRIGSPIRLGPLDGDAALERAHGRVTAALQSMLDDLRGR